MELKNNHNYTNDMIFIKVKGDDTEYPLLKTGKGTVHYMKGDKMRRSGMDNVVEVIVHEGEY